MENFKEILLIDSVSIQDKADYLVDNPFDTEQEAKDYLREVWQVVAPDRKFPLD